MPSSMSKSRLSKAFNEGRRSAKQPAAENPYDNPKLRRLWDDGRAQEQAGAIKTPIPPLEHGETRAQRTPRNPPRPKPPSRSPSRPGSGRSYAVAARDLVEERRGRGQRPQYGDNSGGSRRDLAYLTARPS